MKITKRQLRSVIREEKQRMLKESSFDSISFDSTAIYSALEDLVMAQTPEHIDVWRPDQWLDFKDLVDNAMHELKGRLVQEESEEDRHHRERSAAHRKDWR